MAGPELSLSERIKQRNMQLQDQGVVQAPQADSAQMPMSQRLQQRKEQVIQERFPEARTLTPPPAEEQKDISFAEAGRQAVRNLPRSAYEAGEAFVQPFIHPIQTAENIGALGKGAYSKLKGYAGFEQDEQKKAMDEAALNAVRDFYANRYGSMRGFKQAVAQDPAGVLLDASTIFTLGGGAAARAPGVIGQAGKIVSKVGRATDPMTAIPKAISTTYDVATKVPKVGKYIERGVEAVKKAPGELIESRAGLIPGTLETAFQAGKTGAPELQPFVEQMRQTAPRLDVVNYINEAIDDIKKTQTAEFLKDRNNALAIQTPVSYQPIDDAFNNALKSVQYKGVTGTYKAAEDALSEIKGRIDAFKSNNLNTVQDLDELKRAIDAVYNTYSGDKQARRVITEMKNSVKDTIGAQSPDYLKILEDAEARKGELDSLLFAVGQSGAVPEKQLAKILASTKKQDRLALIEKIAQQDPRIMSALKGIGASEKAKMKLSDLLTLPSLYGLGLAGAGGHLAGIGLAGLGIAAESPRLVGETAYKAGKVASLADNKFVRPIVEALPETSPFLQELGKLEQRREADRQKKEFMKAYKNAPKPTAGRVETDEEKIARLIREGKLPEGTLPITHVPPRATRATGGRIGSAIMKADALIRKADQAKRNLSKETEPMLELPDEHVTKALAVAKAHI